MLCSHPLKVFIIFEQRIPHFRFVKIGPTNYAARLVSMHKAPPLCQTMAIPWPTLNACCPRGEGKPHSQSPVDSDDDGDIICGQPHRGEHDDHGDEPGLGYASCPDAGCRGCDAAGAGRERKRRGRRGRVSCWDRGSKQEARMLGPLETAIWGQGLLLAKPHQGVGQDRGGSFFSRSCSPMGPWPQQNLLRSLWKILCLEPLLL